MQSPHDKLFTFTFRHPQHAAGWVRCALPLALALAIDWESLVPLREC
ncbi:MAG: hypothetical protein H6835_01800 [Planctomycetes bacterium]|nr:hypothetical protein [Planctomycetota bacterium]